MKSRQSPSYSPNDDYYTPPTIFDALGLTFDVDVCAPTGGVPWVPARMHYDMNLDGLSQPWEGLVWCNPPYSGPAPWIERFIEHQNGIMLVQVARSKGFRRLWDLADGIMIPDHNMMRFINAKGQTKTIFMPVGLFAMGKVSYQALLRSNLGRVR